MWRGHHDPMDEILIAKVPPILYRTVLTAYGGKRGSGFRRSFGSKYFAFQDLDAATWLEHNSAGHLAAGKKGEIALLANKFELIPRKNGRWTLKSATNKKWLRGDG